jgi:signal transduction histidine kinase
VTLKRDLSVDSIVADAELLRRVLENLIDNGLRHAPAGSTLTLSAARAGEGIELRVTDQGCGVPAEQREKIFEPFAQGSTEQLLTRTGRGLGLTFCRLAVEAHGGKIRIEGANPGAAFCVFLPNAALPAA